ncbi:sulfotransferase domain-containing protein [Chloroflexota bacterium]
MLNSEINYVVSGLERSGTSLMMQMLHKASLPIASDESRPADEHNPRGYYELAGGKIINRLMDGTFDMHSHGGYIIKITAYGLKFLPKGNYRIIYMKRNVSEVLKSMQKMGADIDMEKDRKLFSKLDRLSLELMNDRDDIEHVTVNYRDLIDDPHKQMERISGFLGEAFDVDAAIKAVEPSLYRNRIQT